MVKLKVHIRHVMLWEFNNKTNAETAKQIYCVYDEHVITDCQFTKTFSKFRSGDSTLIDKPRPGCPSNSDQHIWRELMECNSSQSSQELALDLSTSLSTICRCLRKIGKVSKLSVLLFHTLSEKNKENRLSIVSILIF